MYFSIDVEKLAAGSSVSLTAFSLLKLSLGVKFLPIIDVIVILFDMKLQLEKNRAEQIEKYYPNLICTQSLGHVRNMIGYLFSSIYCVYLKSSYYLCASQLILMLHNSDIRWQLPPSAFINSLSL